MKINSDGTDFSALFQARANSWAPKYEQELWNDCSVGQFSVVTDKYRDILLCVTTMLGYTMKTPQIAHMLSRNDDHKLSLLANTTNQEIREMRRDLMVFLNSTMLSTNCYAYALNIRKGFQPGSKLAPGHLAEMKIHSTASLEGRISRLFKGLAKDGMTFFKGHPDRDLPPSGYYLAAVLTHHDRQTRKMDDFHFVRYDRDGSCSHKTGHGYVTNLDHTGRVITDPTTQEIYPDYKCKGCILVPSVLPQHKFS